MEEDDDDECYVVDAIKSKRTKLVKISRKEEREIAEYLIKWRNYSDSYNSWVDETQLSCFELISEYESREEERRKNEEAAKQNDESKKVSNGCVPMEIDEDVSEDPNNKTPEPATKENNNGDSSNNNNNNNSVEVNGGNTTRINNDTAGSSTPGPSTSTTPGPSTSTSPGPSTSTSTSPGPSASTSPGPSTSTAPGPSASTSPGPSTSTAQDEPAVNIDLYDVTQDKNGFELGLEMKAVIGMARDEDGVQVLVQFTTDDLELIPSTEVAKYAPIFLIEFYEKYIKFNKTLPRESPKKSNSKKRLRKY